MSERKSSHHLPPLRETLDYLKKAQQSGSLGSGPTESPDHPNPILVFLTTIPIFILLTQLIWSSAVVLTLYFVNRDDHQDTFDDEIWTSRASIPSFVSSATGWALFVLLSFFIREATKRYRAASTAFHNVGMFLSYILRIISYNYPSGTWHPGDIDRIVRHIIAYPVALKMSLRNEREAGQLEQILHPDDVKDVIAADAMHTHCLRVVRAYSFSVVDEKPTHAFRFVDAKKNPGGSAATRYMIDVLDQIDLEAQKATAIGEYRSSVAYVNHLNIFLYIWILFLPLALVKTSGW